MLQARFASVGLLAIVSLAGCGGSPKGDPSSTASTGNGGAGGSGATTGTGGETTTTGSGGTTGTGGGTTTTSSSGTTGSGGGPSGPLIHAVYLVPSDRTYKAAYAQGIEQAFRHLQIWYRDQLGDQKTFTLNTPVVETYNLAHPGAWYSTNPPADPNADPNLYFFYNLTAEGLGLTGGKFSDPEHTWIFYVDLDPACGQIFGGGGGVAELPANDLRGLVGEPYVSLCGEPQYMFGKCRWVGGLGHELGHAVGLGHPPQCDANPSSTDPACQALMYYGYVDYPNTFLRPEDKATLEASPFFNVATPLSAPFPCQ